MGGAPFTDRRCGFAITDAQHWNNTGEHTVVEAEYLRVMELMYNTSAPSFTLPCSFFSHHGSLAVLRAPSVLV